MTTLASPPVIGERQTSTHDCGPASLASALEWAGRKDTESGIVAWMIANGRDAIATNPRDFAAYCVADGNLPNVWDGGSVPMHSYVPAALGRGHVVIGLHQCDANANPVPRGSTSRAHWRVFYGDDAGEYQTMNPWTPCLEAIAFAKLDAADMSTHFEVYLALPPRPQPRSYKGNGMLIVRADSGDYLLHAGKLVGITTPLEDAKLTTDGVPIWDMRGDAAQWERLIAQYPHS